MLCIIIKTTKIKQSIQYHSASKPWFAQTDLHRLHIDRHILSMIQSIPYVSIHDVTLKLAGSIPRFGHL